MTISLARAKILKRDDALVVTRTGQVWIVQEVVLNDNPNKVTVKIVNHQKTESFFDETRLGLFDLVDVKKPDLVASQTTALHNTVEKATVVLTEEDDARLEKRIEDSFLKEKPLTKPTRKPRAKKAK